MAEGRKHILMILQADYPPDIRLTKEIAALTGQGYQVFLLCNNKAGSPRVAAVDGATVLRLRHWGARWTPLVNIPLFFNPVWLWGIRQAIRKNAIQSIHVHDLPLALAAIWAGRWFGLPVVFDVHENYPEAMRIWGHKGMFWWLLRNPWLSEKLERHCLRAADAVITVSEEHLELFLQQGVPADKLHFVGNTVDYESYLQMAIDPEIVERYRPWYVLEYLGKFGPERDLETAIRGLKFIRAEIPNIRLLLVGDGPNTAELRQCAREEGVAELVEITGWVPFAQTASYIEACQICIVPQPSNPFIDNTIPHKIFQYMALEKPVVCSDAKALVRIISGSRCGEVFPSRSAEGFARAVLKIYHSDFPYGRNGRHAVEEKYNWSHSAQALIALYDRLDGEETNKD
ncbi:MAG TPA: glycosyltransferase family 4 protein [bacterium]|nr:glycosyltransferase family 4 protein [bacterium]HQG45801.1 glycosyltransferase family 4 protein [bacterium]HQI47706.1 glycosyltransferase family 4 protein [bacterium]HQJ63479.1 glycosyltransferase family 4 protein [bacterium]